MKQFKCSMSKKIESQGKKQESISGKLLLDPEKFEKAIREVIDGETEDILKNVDDNERMYYEMAFDTLGDSDYAGELCKSLQDDMFKYVSGNDYRIMGNFNNIEWDWENAHKDGIKFRDLRKKLLDGVNDADTDEFSTWAIDWFFDTFGTYNMCYNYQNTISDLAYSYQQEDEENGDADESKKSESKKNERGTTKIETYVGFDELLEYADAEYLLEDVVDVLSKYYTYEDDTFDEGQAKGDPEFTIKIEGGDERADFYSEDIFYVHLPNKEAAEELAKVLGGELSESKKPESCKDGKKESMERCDSCGAVMTEYDYDRYGGLCKRCRDKGEAKKPAESSKKSEEVVNNLTSPEAKKIYADVHKNHWKKPKFAELMDRCVADEDCGDLIDYLMGVYGTDIRDTLSEDDELLRLGFTLVDDWREEHGQNESRKKSEGIGSRIKMGIDYNMFMRMCRTAAYLDEDEDYWDALWEYYSEMGEIEDALVFFDNLFQYTAWKTAEELWSDFSDILGDKPEDKDYEEALDAYLDENDNEVGNAAAFKYGDHYLMVY